MCFNICSANTNTEEEMTVSFYGIKLFEDSNRQKRAVMLFVDILMQQSDMRHSGVDFI
jgi:hypothetical protein